VTIAKRPFVGRDENLIEVILARTEAEYFSRPGWTRDLVRANQLVLQLAARHCPRGFIESTAAIAS
jgi:hypothetical protein